jgi:hypothetical protein
METKVCSKCGLNKELCEFNKSKNRLDGHDVYCKECTRKKWKIYQDNNVDKLKKKYVKDKEKNPDYIKNWHKKNPSYNSEYEKKRRSTDPKFYILKKCRNRIRDYFRLKKEPKKNKTFDIVGCTPEFLKEHLEKQFTKGMTWENRSKWHIDHIIPLSSAKTEEELYKLCHYSNLQPLWAGDNLSKGTKVFTN